MEGSRIPARITLPFDELDTAIVGLAGRCLVRGVPEAPGLRQLRTAVQDRQRDGHSVHSVLVTGEIGEIGDRLRISLYDPATAFHSPFRQWLGSPES